MKGTCIILASAPIENYRAINLPIRSENDFVVAADAGFSHAAPLGLAVDLLIGDFDSFSKHSSELPSDVPTQKLPPKKNKSDTWEALDEGLAKGYTDFFIIGGLGGPRLDHTVANLCLLSYLYQKGASGTLCDGTNVVTLVGAGIHTLWAVPNRRISLIPFGGEVHIAFMKGLMYPLKDFTIKPFEPIAISNEFVSDLAEISIEWGELLVFFSQD